MVFCRIRSWLTGRRTVSLPFSDHCEPLVDDPNELDDLLLNLKSSVDSRRTGYIELRPSTTAIRPGSGFEQSLGHLWHIIDLSRPIDTLFGSLHKNCVQRKIRKAERESLDYQSGTLRLSLGSFTIFL